MRLNQLHSEGIASDIGHLGLDVAGLVPGVGEGADLANAMWYISEEKYISAVFSLISMIPEVGDIAAKGIKYLGKGSKLFAKFIAKYGDDIAKWWRITKNMVAKSKRFKKQLGPDTIGKLDRALNKLLSDAKNAKSEPSQARKAGESVQSVQR